MRSSGKLTPWPVRHCLYMLILCIFATVLKIFDTNRRGRQNKTYMKQARCICIVVVIGNGKENKTRQTPKTLNSNNAWDKVRGIARWKYIHWTSATHPKKIHIWQLARLKISSCKYLTFQNSYLTIAEAKDNGNQPALKKKVSETQSKIIMSSKQHATFSHTFLIREI